MKKISGTFKLARIIKHRRKELGWSLLKLAKLSSVHAPIISKIENNLMPPDKHGWKLIEELVLPLNITAFSEKIRQKRSGLNWSVLKLAKASDVSLSSINTVEKGFKISLPICAKIAKALNIPLEDFIEVPAKPSETKPQE